MPDRTPLGPHAQRFVDAWAPRARRIMAMLTGVTIVLLVTWLLGITSFRLFVVAVIARLLAPAVYGGIAGSKITKDRDSV